MGLKHGSVPVSKYIQIHKNVLKNFGIQKEYEIERPTDQYISLEAQFTMTTKNLKSVIVKIEDKLKDPMVKTYSYSYHARYEDGRNLIRHCSPDREVGHRAKHHKHTYDYLGKESKKSPLILKEDTHPHVSEFLDEIYNNY